MCRARGGGREDGGRERDGGGSEAAHEGEVLKAPTIRSEDDLFSFHGGRSAGIVKFLEPLSPLLNYFEVTIHTLSNLCCCWFVSCMVEKRIAVLVIPSSWFLSSFIVQSFF